MPNICEDIKLKEMFLNMSTNRDLRNVLKYYEEKGYDKDGLIADFEEIMEYITTEEIAKRLEQDLYIDFDGIKITNEMLDEALVANNECKNVQLEIISKRSNLSFIAIQLMLDNNVAYAETIDIAIKNSTDPNISELDSEKLCLLNKDSIKKLVELSNGDEEFLYLFSLKTLNAEEIGMILNYMNKNKIEMDNLFGESILLQKNITDEQKKEVAYFQQIPSNVVFDICLNNGLYNKTDIEDFYKYKKDDIEFINIILNYQNTPKSIISDIFINGSDDAKIALNNKTNYDIEFQKTINDLKRTDLSIIETKKIINLIREDARLLPYAVHSPNKNILKETLSSIDSFYQYTGKKSIYETRCELINALANNKNISNLTLSDIILYNSDVFSEDEIQEINALLNSRLTPEEISILDAQAEKMQEELDDYLLDMKIKQNRTYGGDYDYISDFDDYR